MGIATAKNDYKALGYKVFPSLIKSDKVDRILRELEEFKQSNKLYYSQSEHNWRRVSSDIDEYGLLGCSFENFTDLAWARKLSEAGRNILQSIEILNALTEVSDENDFCMWQNMFFDKSTGTVDHIDTWYLDTNPMGHLIGAWVALEDIDGSGGSFHIYPESHLSGSNKWVGLNHNEFVEWSLQEAGKYKKKSIVLEKGDVLLWHPSLIHGSSQQKNVGASRKSLTAHYYPTKYLRGGGGINNKDRTKSYLNKLRKQQRSSRTYGYPISCRSSRRSILKFVSIGIVKYILNDFLNNPKNLMNRKHYNKF